MKAVINRGNSQRINNTETHEKVDNSVRFFSRLEIDEKNTGSKPINFEVYPISNSMTDGEYVKDIYKNMKDKCIPIPIGAKLLANRVITIILSNRQTYLSGRANNYYEILSEAMTYHLENVIENGNFDENALKGIIRIIDEILDTYSIEYDILAEFKEMFHDLF